MIHQFINNGYLIVLDVNSSSVFELDETSYIIINAIDMLSFDNVSDVLFSSDFKETIYKKSCEIFNNLKDTDILKKADLSYFDEVYDEICKLVKENILFTKPEDIDIEYIKDRQTNIKALCLHIAHDCNLACKYCFASEGNYKGKKELMSFDTGKKALDFLIKNSGKRVNLEVDFFGGEPLMNFEVIKKLVEYGRKQEKIYNKNFRFTLTTNGLLVDDEVIEFANKEMSNVVLSLDGRKEINDTTRPTINGKGSYDIITPKFIKFANSRGQNNYYIRGTYTHYNLDFYKDVMHFVDLGFKQISMEPVVAPNDKDYAIKEEDLPTIKDSYDKLAIEVLNAKKNNNPFNFFHFMIDLKGGPCIFKRVTGCGSGCEYLSVTPSGELYPCHQFVGETDFKLGDLDSGITNNKIVEQFKNCNIFTKTECNKCFAKYFCSGGCMANAYYSSGNINGRDVISCELQRKRVECAIMIRIANKEVDNK